MSRHILDFYPTPDFFTLCLEDWLAKQTHLSIETALEPFWGKGDIPKILEGFNWYGSDIVTHDPDKAPDWNFDLSLKADRLALASVIPPVDVIISNPPYNLIGDLELMEWLIQTPNLFTALLLRQTWLNPGSGRKGTNGRKKILDHIKGIITVPRYPMAVNSKTGDLQCDACNHAWVIFSKNDYIPIKSPLSFYDSKTVEGWTPWN